MKNRRIVLVCFLLVAAMTIGIGYANLSDTLSVSGTASIDADNSQEVFEGDIYFANAVVKDARATATIGDQTVGTETHPKDAVTIAVNEGIFHEVGTEVVVTLTVKSENDLPVYVTVGNVNNNIAEYFSITVLAAGSAGNTALINPTAGTNTVDYVVTIRQIKTAVQDQALDFNFELTASTSNPNA